MRFATDRRVLFRRLAWFCQVMSVAFVVAACGGGSTGSATPASANTATPITTAGAGVSTPGVPGPAIDMAKVPAAAVGYASMRVQTTWRSSLWYDPHTGAVDPSCTSWNDHCATDRLDPSCVASNPNCYIVDAQKPVGPGDIGAFRVNCAFAKMTKDDPIVFPGQAGRSHLHTYFGNTEVNASSTAASLLSSGNSTCSGGTANRTAYWVPTMIDTRDGTPLAPSTNNIYYKGSYEFQAASRLTQPVPAGLRMVAGNAANTDPNGVGARYACRGTNGENPGWSSTITEAVARAKGTCNPGADFIMSVNFPFCWDGVNLDSPDHASHMSNAVRNPGDADAHCPADHPVVLPTISYNIHYAVPYTGAAANWRLSSDLYAASLPAGLSGHGDYFMAWDPATMRQFVDNCNKRYRDCHDDLLGNDMTLY